MPRRQMAKRFRLRMEQYAYRAAAQFGAHVGGDVVHGGVISLGPGYDGLGHGDYVPVTDGKAVLAGGLKNRLGDDLHQVVPAADDGSANPP